MEFCFKSHGDIKELPQEIIEDILLRLPLKSLGRCKCVSKRLCSLISSAHFIKAHLKKSSKDESLERHHIILINYVVQANQCLLPSFLYEPLATTCVHIDYPTYGTYDSGIFIGSCNGLVCLLKHDFHFILWNPSTGKFRELPSALDDDEGVLCKRDDVYGFGFDESNDDYKVFFVWSFYPFGVGSKQLAKIYSLKTNSWRTVDVPAVFDPKHTYGSGIFVSGKLHWQSESDYRSDIVSFDLENEISATVERPNKDGVITDSIDGCLCCYSSSPSNPNHLDCWLLKEYGVKDSWYKFATLVHPRLVVSDDDDVDDDEDAYFRPLFVGPNGDILGWFGFSLCIIYRKEDGRYLSPSMRDLSVFCPTTYVESLVEP